MYASVGYAFVYGGAWDFFSSTRFITLCLILFPYEVTEAHFHHKLCNPTVSSEIKKPVKSMSRSVGYGTRDVIVSLLYNSNIDNIINIVRVCARYQTFDLIKKNKFIGRPNKTWT